MNKAFIIGLISILFVSCYATKSTSVSISPISETYEIDGKQNELYIKANNWMAETFADSKSVIQFRDKESGSITGKYLLNKGITNSGMYGMQTTISDDVYAIIKIRVENNTANIEIKPNSYQYRKSPVEMENFTQEKAEKQIKNLIGNFHEYMKG